MKPFISVALPVYKIKFLESALQSVLKQSYLNFELIILNDNSPEDVDSIIEKYMDPRIRYFKNDVNIGEKSLVTVWNQCLEYSVGEFFILFSDDDFYEPKFIEELIKLTNKYPSVNLFHTRVIKINENDEIITFSPLCPEFESGLDFIWHSISGYRMQFVPDFMARTSTLKMLGGFYNLPLAWGSDYITWYKVALTNGVAYVSQPLCRWRISGLNISRKGSVTERILAINKYSIWLSEFVDSYHPKNDYEIEVLRQIAVMAEDVFDEKKFYLLTIAAEDYGLFKLLLFLIQTRNKKNITWKLLVKTILIKLVKIFKL